MRIVFIALLALSVSGFSCTQFVTRAPDAFDTKCEQSCHVTCTETRFPVGHDPDTAILSEKIEHEYRKACEVRRAACEQCWQRGVDAGRIK